MPVCIQAGVILENLVDMDGNRSGQSNVMGLSRASMMQRRRVLNLTESPSGGSRLNTVPFCYGR